MIVNETRVAGARGIARVSFEYLPKLDFQGIPRVSRAALSLRVAMIPSDWLRSSAKPVDLAGSVSELANFAAIRAEARRLQAAEKRHAKRNETNMVGQAASRRSDDKRTERVLIGPRNGIYRGSRCNCRRPYSRRIVDPSGVAPALLHARLESLIAADRSVRFDTPLPDPPRRFNPPSQVAPNAASARAKSLVSPNRLPPSLDRDQRE